MGSGLTARWWVCSWGSPPAPLPAIRLTENGPATRAALYHKARVRVRPCNSRRTTSARWENCRRLGPSHSSHLSLLNRTIHPLTQKKWGGARRWVFPTCNGYRTRSCPTRYDRQSTFCTHVEPLGTMEPRTGSRCRATDNGRCQSRARGFEHAQGNVTAAALSYLLRRFEMHFFVLKKKKKKEEEEEEKAMERIC